MVKQFLWGFISGVNDTMKRFAKISDEIIEVINPFHIPTDDD